MPYRRYKKKLYVRKRRNNNYSRYKRRTSRRTRGVRRLTRRFRQLTTGSFPIVKTVKLKYVENITLDPPAAGSAATYTFRCNSLFDPNFTGTGHQPMFYDNYSAIYGQYTVVKSFIKVTATDTKIVNVAYSNEISGTTTSQGQFFNENQRAVRMFIIRDRGNTDYTNLDTLIEEGNKNFTHRWCPQNTSYKMPVIKYQCTPHKLLGIDYMDDTLQSATNNNPSNVCFYIFGVESFPTDNADSMSFQVQMTFYAKFSNLIKNQTQN